MFTYGTKDRNQWLNVETSRPSLVTAHVRVALWVLTFAAVLAPDCLAFAQEAKAVIDGPKQVLPGDLIVLDASRSQGRAFHWVLNSKKTFLTFENGRKLVFATGTPQEYVFVLIVGDSDGREKVSVDIAEHRVTVGSLPGPSPDLPRGRWGFAQAACGWVKELVPDDQRHYAEELAKNFEATAAVIENGEYDGLPGDEAIKKANLALQSLNRASLKYVDSNNQGDTKVWLPFFAAWQKKADSHNPPTEDHPQSDGTLRSVRDYAQAYKETAAGLKASIQRPTSTHSQ